MQVHSTELANSAGLPIVYICLTNTHLGWKSLIFTGLAHIQQPESTSDIILFIINQPSFSEAVIIKEKQLQYNIGAVYDNNK